MNQKPAHRFNWKLFLFSLVVFLVLILAAEGWYYWHLKGKLSDIPQAPLSSPSPQSSPAPSNLPPVGQFTATENIDVYDSPGGKKLGFFVPGQSFNPTDKQEGEWIQVIDATQGHVIWIQKNSPYQPTGKQN